MPNWCDTTYKCVGKEEEILSLHATLETLQKDIKSRVENGFGHMWLGNVIDALGGDWEKFSCRGEIESFSLDDGVLTIFQSTAWNEQEGFRYFIQAKYPSIKVYYLEEEPGCDVYFTNDTFGTCFPERYLLDGYERHDYYGTLETVAAEVSKLTGCSVHTTDEINQALDTYNELHEDDDNFCYFHEFVRVSE